MNNMSIRAILLSAFSVMVIALVAIFGLGFSALGASADGVVEIARTNSLVTNVVATEKYVLESVVFSLDFTRTKNKSSFVKYKNLYKRSMRNIDNIDKMLKDPKLKKLTLSIKENFNRYDEAIKSSSMNLETVKDSLLSKLDTMHKKIITL